MRVGTPEVGKTYWGKSGRQFRIYATDGSREYPIHAAELIDDGWRVCTMSADNVHLYDADPTKPDPLPLDLTKPVRTRNGHHEVANIRKQGNLISGTVGAWFCQWDQFGRSDLKHKVECSVDLVQCTRRDWTAADVPFPRPTFRLLLKLENEHTFEAIIVRHDGIRFLDIGIARWPELARDWQYTTDGKTWQECCKWE